MNNNNANANLLKHDHILLWLASFFSMITIAQATGIEVALVSFIAFFIVAFMRYKGVLFNTFQRLTSFVVLVVITLIISGGLTADAGTGFLSCLIVTKLPHLKERKDGHVLIFFNILTPFIAFLQFQTPMIFILGIIALFLSMAGAKVLTETTTDTNHIKVVMRTISSTLTQSLFLLPIVFVLYILAPRLDSPLWASYVSTQRTGVGDEMNVSQWSRLLDDTSTALRVSFSTPPPPNNEMYFRGSVLWTFDGNTWKQSPSNHKLDNTFSSYSPDLNSKTHQYSVSYESIRSNRVFALDYPIYKPDNTIVRSDGSISLSSPRQNLNEITWQSSGVLFEDLDEGERLSALQLPEKSNPMLVKWAVEKREEFETDKDFIDYIMNYFSSGFEYSTSPPRLSKENSMDDFFFNKKSGFCPHYSSAFAIIMRAANIPTRIVNGYIGHESVMVGGYYRIRQADAHAWNEVWLDGEWVRLDPTHQVSTIRTRNDFAWNILSITHDMVDLLKVSWDGLFFNFNQQTQKKIINDIKDFALSINVKNIIFIFSGLIIFFVAVFLSFKIKLFTFKKSFAKDVDIILNSWSDFNEGDTWQIKIDFILPFLDTEDKKIFLEAMSEARTLVYNPSSTNSHPRKIIKILKKMKKNKSSVK